MLHTIGHSTFSPEEFLARCKHAGIRKVLDVRSHPKSKWQHFNRAEMEGPESWLAAEGIGYEWMPGLGGWSAESEQDPAAVRIARDNGIEIDQYTSEWFPKSHISKTRTESGSGPMWTNQGMYDFAWYMATERFLTTGAELIRRADKDGYLQNPALMCTEYVWWKCHRAMIADWLHWNGVRVHHALPASVMHDRVIGDRLNRYPREVLAAWGPQKRLPRMK